MTVGFGLAMGILVAVFLDEIAETDGRLVGPIIGSIVALLIAFVAYPWQKEKDRHLELGREARQVAQELLSHLNVAVTQIAGEGVIEPDTQQTLNAAYQRLHFYFDDDELECAAKLFDVELTVAKEWFAANNGQGAQLVISEDELLGNFILMVREKYHDN